MLESRINAFEKLLNHDSNVSLKLEYIEKSGKNSSNKGRNMPSIHHLSQSVEALERYIIKFVTCYSKNSIFFWI